MCKFFKNDICYIKVRVTPRASKNEIRGIKNGELLIYTTAVAENNKANEAIIKLLSKTLKIAKSNFYVESGAKNRSKIIACLRDFDMDFLEIS